MNIKDLGEFEIEEVPAPAGSESKSLNLSDIGEFELEEAEDPSITESLLRGAAQGTTFGLSDEITGAGEALGKAVFGDDKLKDLLNNYRKYRDESREAYKVAEEANPVAYNVGDIGAGIGTGLLTGGAGAVANLGRVGAKAGVKELAKLGAKQGAAFGLGQSEADLTEGELTEAGKDTLIGGAAGGVLGAGLPLAARGAGKAVKGTAKFVGDTDLGQDIQKAFEFGTKGKKTYGKEGREQFVKAMEETTDEILTYVDTEHDQVNKMIGDMLESTPKRADVSNILNTLESNVLKAEVPESKKQKALEIIEAYRKTKELPLKVKKTGDIPEVNIKGEEVARENLERAKAQEQFKAGLLGDEVSFGADIVDPDSQTIGTVLRGRNAAGEDIARPITKPIPEDVFSPASSDIQINPQGQMVDYVEPKSAQGLKVMRDNLYDEADKVDNDLLSKLFKGSSREVRETIPGLMSRGNREAYEQANQRSAELHGLKENLASLRSNKTDLNREQGVMRLLSKDDENFINQLGKNTLLEELPEELAERAGELGDWNQLSKRGQALFQGSDIFSKVFGGVAQTGRIAANELGQAASSKAVRTPVEIVGKLTSLPNEAIQSVSQRMRASNSPANNKIADKLDEALASADNRDRLLWSLSRQPAFRQAIEEMGADLDEDMYDSSEAQNQPEMSVSSEEPIADQDELRRQLLERFRANR